MKSARMVLPIMMVLGVLTAAAETPTEITLFQEPYLPGPQELVRFQKNEPQFLLVGDTGFIDVPLSYQIPNSPTMKMFYRLPKPLDPAKPSILYFYGGPGGMSAFSNLEVNLEHFNVIYFDQRGTGFSKPDELSQLQNPDYFSSESIARDAVLLLKHLQVDRVTVYGHSYGTIPATMFGSLFPEMSRAVVLEGVIFSGDQNLWGGPHRVKLVQKFFDTLPKDLQDKILSLSQSGKIDTDWFSRIAQQKMYEPDFRTSLRKELDEGFVKPEADWIASIKTQISNDFFFKEGVFSGAYMFHHIACQELSENTPGSTFGANFVNGKLVASSDKISNLCETLPGEKSHIHGFYQSINYPIKVPVTYFQGTEDGATPAPEGISHYKNVPKAFAQLILVKQSGHMPMIGCLSQKKEDPALSTCPRTPQFTKVVDAAFQGQPISKQDLKDLDPQGRWVMTSRQ